MGFTLFLLANAGDGGPGGEGKDGVFLGDSSILPVFLENFKETFIVSPSLRARSSFLGGASSSCTDVSSSVK